MIASKAIRWALSAALAAALTGCEGQPSVPETAAAKTGSPPPNPTATAKEKSKTSTQPKSAVD